MKVRLKTIDQLKEEFGFKFDGYDYTTIFNNMQWYINNEMFEYLGKELEVRELNDDDFDMRNNYTHKDLNIKYKWHELWFKQFVSIEFIKEDEFEI